MSNSFLFHVDENGDCERIVAPSGTMARAVCDCLMRAGIEYKLLSTEVTLTEPKPLEDIAKVAGPKAARVQLSQTGTVRIRPPMPGSNP